ncbi:MAG TPA: type II toxin-antitoxin system Phd/YefM family antitoxin [Thermoanaerobaculia bacterium]|nr:type II toxin-antitoxin system Phd/YefM family antitoxin [Thermoanaerobaculia bacterium]
MTKTAPASEVKENFAEYVRSVEGGESVVITRYGRPVAVLLSASRYERMERLTEPTADAGLAGLAGRWEDGDELADELERVVRARAAVRALDELDHAPR